MGAPRVSASLLDAAPSAGFDEPFELMTACHGRVQRMLALAARIAERLAASGPDADTAGAARDVIRYFDLAGPAHHEDEERHVLPRLRTLGRGDVADRLHDDHLRMEAGWRGVRADLARVADGAAPAGDPATWRARWQDFAALYDAHIELEESVAYPEARAGLAPAMIDAMGREMAARRGARSG